MKVCSVRVTVALIMIEKERIVIVMPPQRFTLNCTKSMERSVRAAPKFSIDSNFSKMAEKC